MVGRAVVVGAGISGLAVGRALLAAGWEVELRERAHGLPEAGTALGMWPEALAALDALGVGDRVRHAGAVQHGAAFLRPDGTEIAAVRTPAPAVLLSRPALHRFLWEGKLEDAVRWGDPLEDLAELTGTDMSDADLVVGADGIHSRLRSVVAGQEVRPRELRVTAFRGTVPGPVETTCETWGPGRLFGVTPQESGMANWFAAVRDDLLDECSGLPDDELLSTLFGDWHPGVRDVVALAGSAGIDRRRIFDLPPLRSWHRGRVVILGDAAHAMAPNIGRGACEAIIDAVVLAEALSVSATVEAGLRVFDRRRRRAAQRVVRASRLLSRVSTARRLPETRRRALRVVAGLVSSSLRREGERSGHP
ncbi:FAD-dependent monooxygenase [Nesterenkonia sp. PF2B19]|uniref:FAD-dependent monooxygenase n=1 Tax=Nesterenkonia sp. PF2B19 TaxID=1881858 RepID=UPI00087310A5|nr:FAD-dependent monooxygenase [Nesterenkonia sp. PF2B19]OSM43017.1 hypothetical protein BCY76_010990 [Nesterenkonia sp. PF2B19]